MKLSASQKVHYDSGPNMTPLVDVVMVILIFLMLTGTFTGLEHYLQSQTPITDIGGEPNPTGGFEKKTTLRINVNPQGEGFVASIVPATTGTTDPAVLAGLLKQKYDQFQGGNIKDEDLQVIISPHVNVEYQHLMDVYNAAIAARFKQVSFSTARS